MALITEDVQASEPPSTAPSKPPARSNRAILGWAAFMLALAASAVLAIVVLRDDSTTSARPWTGDVNDHLGLRARRPGDMAWTGEVKDHLGLSTRRHWRGPATSATTPATGPSLPESPWPVRA